MSRHWTCLKLGHDSFRERHAVIHIKGFVTEASHVAVSYIYVLSLVRIAPLFWFELFQFHRSAHVNHNLAITIYHGPDYIKATAPPLRNFLPASSFDFIQASPHLSKTRGSMPNFHITEIHDEDQSKCHAPTASAWHECSGYIVSAPSSLGSGRLVGQGKIDIPVDEHGQDNAGVVERVDGVFLRLRRCKVARNVP